MFVHGTFVEWIDHRHDGGLRVAENQQKGFDKSARSADSGGFGVPSSEGFEPRAIEVAPMSIRRTAGTVVAEKFALQRVIASGGMGTVFEAWDTYIERKVALKIMPCRPMMRSRLQFRS